jgi:hypothetical protein
MWVRLRRRLRVKFGRQPTDGLLLWWEERKQDHSHVKHLVINMDNGPECNGHRSQFLYRMAEFDDVTGLKVRLIYYPPYHSKYYSIERFWAGLEKSWNGYLLDSVTTGVRPKAHMNPRLPPASCPVWRRRCSDLWSGSSYRLRIEIIT